VSGPIIWTLEIIRVIRFPDAGGGGLGFNVSVIVPGCILCPISGKGQMLQRGAELTGILGVGLSVQTTDTHHRGTT
jgi:hypothetical protein